MREMLQSVIFIPPKKKISELFTELQKSKSHLAIVTDQYGGNMGIVTLEDILEELVGEIWDEYDEEENEFLQMDENTFEAVSYTHLDVYKRQVQTFNQYTDGVFLRFQKLLDFDRHTDLIERCV